MPTESTFLLAGLFFLAAALGYFFARSGVRSLKSSLKLTGSNPHKSRAIPVIRIHVGLELKYKSTERFFKIMLMVFRILIGLRTWRQILEIIQKYIQAKIVQC